MSYKRETSQIVSWAHLLNKRGFVTARSGNISYKVDENKILITSHDCYLGFLEEKDILSLDLRGGEQKDKKEVSSERFLHLEIQKKFKDVKVVLHTHSPYTTAFFNYFDDLEKFCFEVKFYLGNVLVIPQETPTVTNIEPVIKALENSNVVVLKNHGVVAVGSSFTEAFSLIELLEEQAKVNFAIKGAIGTVAAPTQKVKERMSHLSRYKMLSGEHIERLVELVNNDQEVQELGRKYDLTCTLAVKNQDKDEAVCFYYEKGKIVKVDNSQTAEFLIIGEEEILKKVFNREIDPFVASTQGKVKTKGDFAKMSRWYPVLVKTFSLWERAPVY
ncbi:MAG: class II aldolase/adducin family protein [Candidatus Omnitrophota bacterium]|nr:MAG: class II aldolase/adducin family protein [Candidatus Omnitrophota bacterium]